MDSSIFNCLISSPKVTVATLETQRAGILKGDGPDLLVVDEYQMLGDLQRGVNYEVVLAMVADGHGGSAASKHCEQLLLDYFLAAADGDACASSLRGACEQQRLGGVGI